MIPPLLSILTPTVFTPERIAACTRLREEVERQIEREGVEGRVEHLVLGDNRARSIGLKRQALVQSARGQFVAFCDDDDFILPDYLHHIMKVIQAGSVDVVTFRQEAIVNEQSSTVIFRLGQGDGPFVPGGETLRDAWHVCAWRRALIGECRFPDRNYGEDQSWSVQARARVRREVHIPHVLHRYEHSTAGTLAPA